LIGTAFRAAGGVHSELFTAPVAGDEFAGGNRWCMRDLF